MKGLNVLSLFDGMSCGQQALSRLNIKVDKYYASEIDPYAISVTQYNYPDSTIQLGDIREIKGKDLPPIDLILGGSPCQGFSYASHGKLNFNHPQSVLFFEFVRLLKEIKPRYFLLENVRMANDHKKIITEYMEVNPIEIDSALLSGQRRKRLYWTNIPNVTQPSDRKIMLKDVLENGEKNLPMYSNIYGGFKEKKPRVHHDKSVTIRTAAGGGHIPSVTKYENKIYNRIEKQKVIVRKHFVNNNELIMFLRKHRSVSVAKIAEHCSVPLTQAAHWFRQDSSFSIPPGEVWDKLKEILGITTNEWDKRITEFEERDGVYEMSERITQTHGKNPTLKASIPNKIEEKNHLKNMTRLLKPIEAERLQTINDNLTAKGIVDGKVVKISDTQRYKMIGNGWTVEVIAHILKNIIGNPSPRKLKEQAEQLKLFLKNKGELDA